MNVYTTFESLYDDPIDNEFLEYELSVIPIKATVVIEHISPVQEIECEIHVGPVEEQ